MPAPDETKARLTEADLDLLLTAQLVVAWAGEAGEEPRLGWWRSDLVSEFGGHDLFQRLLPHTWEWAALQGAREAARRRDAELRAKASNPDRIVSLFHLGFEVDELVEERLLEHKRSGRAPGVALPVLAEQVTESWDATSFASWLATHAGTDAAADPVGRRLKGSPPDSVAELTERLVAALAPLGDEYPLPHFQAPR